MQFWCMTTQNSDLSITENTKNYAMANHFGGVFLALLSFTLPLTLAVTFVPSLIFYFSTPNDTFLRSNAKNSMNFFLTWAIIYIITIALITLFLVLTFTSDSFASISLPSMANKASIFGVIVGSVFYLIHIVFLIVCGTIAAVKAKQGELFVYPLSFKFFK